MQGAAYKGSNQNSVSQDPRKEAGRWLRAKGMPWEFLKELSRARQHGILHIYITDRVLTRPGSSDRMKIWAQALEVDPREFAIKLMNMIHFHMSSSSVMKTIRDSRLQS